MTDTFVLKKRDLYLNKLIAFRDTEPVKVVTGIRRCGKSYLLKNIYRDYLLHNGIKDEQILTIELDLAKDVQFRDPLYLSSYVRKIVTAGSKDFYLFVDEIQMSDEVPNPYNKKG